MVRRALRLACPACGKGRLFRRHFLRKRLCGHCGWQFDRELGHWVGGAELHMFVSYGLSVVLFVPVLLLVPATPLMMTGVIAGHVVVSLLLFRWSRAFFLAFDYLLDPTPPGSDDDDSGGVPDLLEPLPPTRGAHAEPDLIEA